MSPATFAAVFATASSRRAFRADPRWRRAIVGVMMISLAAGCSGGGGESDGERLGPDDTPLACASFGDLDSVTAAVRDADPNDPTEFERAMRTARREYLAALKALRRDLPEAMRPKLDAVRQLVEVDDYAGATQARAPLDDWYAENC